MPVKLFLTLSIEAIINYGLEFLSERGFTPLSTPQFMLKVNKDNDLLQIDSL